MAGLISPCRHGIELLLTRHSVPRPEAPGPDDVDLDSIFHAVARVPDFHHLRPYRFLLARGDGLVRLGFGMQKAAIRCGKPADIVARAAQLPLRAPLVAVGIFSPKPSSVVPMSDQLYCAVCAVFAFQVAAHGLGYCSIWRTGWVAREPAFHNEIGLGPDETIVGFLYVGSSRSASDARSVGAQRQSSGTDVAFRWL